MLADDFNLDQRPCSQMNTGSTFEHMLFDLENDPYETTNLYYDDSYATVRVRYINHCDSVNNISVYVCACVCIYMYVC